MSSASNPSDAEKGIPEQEPFPSSLALSTLSFVSAPSSTPSDIKPPGLPAEGGSPRSSVVKEKIESKAVTVTTSAVAQKNAQPKKASRYTSFRLWFNTYRSVQFLFTATHSLTIPQEILYNCFNIQSHWNSPCCNQCLEVSSTIHKRLRSRESLHSYSHEERTLWTVLIPYCQHTLRKGKSSSPMSFLIVTKKSLLSVDSSVVPSWMHIRPSAPRRYSFRLCNLWVLVAYLQGDPNLHSTPVKLHLGPRFRIGNKPDCGRFYCLGCSMGPQHSP